MLVTLVVLLIMLWLLGVVTHFTLGGAIHVLVVIALVLFVLQMRSGRSVD